MPPFKDGVHFLSAFVGTTLFRHQEYQVQMWTCAPNSVIPEHSHPGVDNIQIYLWGQVYLTHNGQPVISDEQMVEKDGLSAAYTSVDPHPTWRHTWCQHRADGRCIPHDPAVA